MWLQFHGCFTRAYIISRQVWNKLPDLPYSTYSINHYKGRLIRIEIPRCAPMVHIHKILGLYTYCRNSLEYHLSLTVHVIERFIFDLIGALHATGDNNITCMLFVCNNCITVNILLSYQKKIYRNVSGGCSSGYSNSYYIFDYDYIVLVVSQGLVIYKLLIEKFCEWCKGFSS